MESLSDNVPVLTSELLRQFIYMQEIKHRIEFPEVLPTKPKFLIHVPRLDDGEGDLQWLNIKEATIKYKEGATRLEDVRYESHPQKVATNGSGWIAVNASDRYYAGKWQQHLNELIKQNGGVINRKVLKAFLHFIQGFSPSFKTQDNISVVESIAVNPDSVVSFAFDVYSLPQSSKTIFEDRPIRGLALDGHTGLFYKKAEPYNIFFIPGHFKVEYKRRGAWLQVQEYKEGAYITVSPRGDVASIDPTNIDACYGFLNKGYAFGDVIPGQDRSGIVNPISQQRDIVPVFSCGDIQPDEIKKFFTEAFHCLPRGYDRPSWSKIVSEPSKRMREPGGFSLV